MRELAQQSEDGLHAQSFAYRAVGLQERGRAPGEALGRIRFGLLPFQEGGGGLDETFVKITPVIARDQPEFLQHFMRVEIFLPIETGEVGAIPGIEFTHGRS